MTSRASDDVEESPGCVTFVAVFVGWCADSEVMKEKCWVCLHDERLAVRWSRAPHVIVTASRCYSGPLGGAKRSR